MTPEALRNTVAALLAAKHESYSIRDALEDFAAEGGTQEQAYQVLREMRRSAADEAEEDCILELMDFVSGFCSPHLVIWPRTGHRP